MHVRNMPKEAMVAMEVALEHQAEVMVYVKRRGGTNRAWSATVSFRDESSVSEIAARHLTNGGFVRSKRDANLFTWSVSP